MKLKFTERALEAKRRQAIRDGKNLLLWDTELQGLGARASAHGRLSWLVQKWQGGRHGGSTRVVIGSFPVMSLDAARTEAKAKLSEVEKGADLVTRRAERRRAKREQLRGVTLQDAWTRYYRENSKPGRYWSEFQDRFEKLLPVLNYPKLSEVTKEDIRAIINEKQKDYPGAARTLFVGLFPFFSWCVKHDMLSASPMATLPRPKPAEKRDRVLSESEIKSFWAATLVFPVYGPFYRLLFLTSQRLKEVSGMEWKELDLDKATWLIPKERTKNGKEHLVHLSPQAMKIITKLAKSELDSAFVFSTTGNTHIAGYGRAKDSLDDLMKPEKPWRTHDLRRTAASGMAALGFQPHIIERVLNHLSGAQGGLVSVYQRHEYLPERKRALEAWGTYVENLVSEKPVLDNVVPLVRA